MNENNFGAQPNPNYPGSNSGFAPNYSGNLAYAQAPVYSAPQPAPGYPGGPIVSGPVPVSAQAPASSAGVSSGKKSGDIVKIIAIVILSLALVTFIGLFVWMFTKYDAASTNLETQIDAAVNDAVKENTEQMNEKFDEQEKYPYYTFAGPVNYGELSFEYPKTWSLFVSADASDGKDYYAYLNPGGINPISKTNVNATRVSILNKSTEDVLKEYEQYRNNNKEVHVDVSSKPIGKNAVNATIYTGDLKDTEGLKGYVVIFPIRDKTVILQCDAYLFQADFEKLLASVTFNA